MEVRTTSYLHESQERRLIYCRNLLPVFKAWGIYIVGVLYQDKGSLLVKFFGLLITLQLNQQKGT